MSKHLVKSLFRQRAPTRRNFGSTFMWSSLALAAVCFASIAVPNSSKGRKKMPDTAAMQVTRPCAKALDLSREPTDSEIMAAGQLGGLLYPTHEISDRKRGQQANLAFGKAIDAWNQHDYRHAVDLFRRHVKAFPDSPWVAEAELHIGCDATYNGRYTEADAIFRKIISTNQGKSDKGARMMLGKARQRLALVKVYENNLEEAEALFGELKESSPDWRQRTYASHWIQRLSRYSADRRLLADCGTKALARVLRKAGRKQAAERVAKRIPQSERGESLRALKELAEGFGYMLTGIDVAPSDSLEQVPLPAILQIPAHNSGDKGHYWVLERVAKERCELTDPQSGRRFTQTFEELRSQWEGKALVVADPEHVPGRVLDDAELETFCGQCCGAPRDPDGLGSPGNNGVSGSNSSGSCSQGAPIWQVNVINMNLFVTDTPLWYEPAIGPPVSITLSYNSQSSIANYEPFGNKWQFNYGSYLIVDTSGSVMIFMPDGRIDVFYPHGTSGYTQRYQSYNSLLKLAENGVLVPPSPNGTGRYTRPYQVYNTLVKLAENHFELRFPDDSVYVYRIPPGTGSQQPFLTEIRDPYGNRLVIGYDANVNLTTITAADGNLFTFSYDANGLCTNVADPFGRNARFEYDADKNLTRITDMGEFGSAFTYDEDIYLTSISDDRGTWQFWIEPAGPEGNSDNYPPPGDPNMWENYRITVTDPMGGLEEFFYYAGCDPDGYGCSGYTWHVSPRHYIPWESDNVNNYHSRPPKTRYLPIQTASGQRGEIDRIVHPNGGTTSYEYDLGTGLRTSVTDPHGHTTHYTYDSMGQITSVTDPKNTTTTLIYAINQVDLLAVSNGLGAVRMTYNAQHDLTSIADRLSNTMSFAYHTNGQLLAQVDALGITNRYLYDANRRLSEFRRAGQTLKSYTYDAVGRVATETEATGLTLSYDYTSLNSVSRITYPDGRYEEYTYSTCCPRLRDSFRDRAGRLTLYEYDALKRLVAEVNPENGVTRYEYDADGNRTKLMDPNGNATTWTVDAENRMTHKTYADGKGLSYAYDLAGLMTNRTNARGIATTYTYDANENRLTITYSDDTPGVTNSYDAYNRLIQVVDGIGISTYTYDADPRLLTYDGPWQNDTITYTYDVLGQRTNLLVHGGSGPTGYLYDELNRLTTVTVGTDAYSYTYTNANPLVQRLDRPNGSYSTYAYDSLNRLTGISNRKSTQEIINQFLYTYNDQDLRNSESINNGVAHAFTTNQLIRYDYNHLNELLATTPPEQLFAYDDDGNMTRGYTPQGLPFVATYDAENRLKTITVTNGGSLVARREYLYAWTGFLVGQKNEQNNQTNRVRYIRDDSLALQERDGFNAVTRNSLWGLDKGGGIGGLLDIEQEGEHYSLLFDGRGNVSVALNTSQNVAAGYAYDEFGVLHLTAGTLDQPFCFATKSYDRITGLSDFGFRFYTAAFGRWVSRDPLGEHPDLNLYAFVHNDPVNRFDPLGLSDVSYQECFKRCVRKCIAETSTETKTYCKPIDWMTKIAGCLGGAMTGVQLCAITGHGALLCAAVGCVAGVVLPSYLGMAPMICESGIITIIKRRTCMVDCSLEPY